MSNTGFIIHKEGQPDVLQVSANGRITTEPFERPDWCPEGVVLALLAQRNQFYLTRLGSDLAKPIIETNIINVLDIDWVAVNEDGDEITIAADDEFRQGMLASALGVEREEGAIAGAIVDHYIDKTGAVMTAAEVEAEAKHAQEKFGNQQAQAAQAQG